MNLSPTICDNIAEVLRKVIVFTEKRDKILTANIVNSGKKNYLPRDLDENGFADIMAAAVGEYLKNDRLLLVDTGNFKFLEQGDFDCRVLIDTKGKQLFENDIKQYLEYQIRKLSQNTLNNKIARELLKQNEVETVG